jgi:hypothetical protein
MFMFLSMILAYLQAFLVSHHALALETVALRQQLAVLRTFTDSEGHFWLEQNANKKSKWAQLVRDGHQMAWEFDCPGGSYTGRMLIDGEIYTPGEATKKFLRTETSRQLGASLYAERAPTKRNTRGS